MKTAMQELIDFMENFELHDTDVCIMEAKNLLKKERQQIEDAYKKGCQDTYGVDEPCDADPDDSKEASYYYNKTYSHD